MQGDVEYFTKRASDERRRAMSAAHPNAREAHFQMAERYSELASAIARQEILLGTRNAVQPVS
jgi:hypothetical protein